MEWGIDLYLYMIVRAIVIIVAGTIVPSELSGTDRIVIDISNVGLIRRGR